MMNDSRNTPDPLQDFPGQAGTGSPTVKSNPHRWSDLWDNLLRMGLGDTALRIGAGVASILLVLLVVWVLSNFYLKGQVNRPSEAALAAPLPTATPTVAAPKLDLNAASIFNNGITRIATLHTVRPDKSRFAITQYEVQKGDTIIGIAEKFGLDPRSILWGNFDALADDPHRLTIGLKLNILPEDGVLYKWHAGDGLNGVSEFFGVKPDAIIDWPGNNLNRANLGDLAKPNINPDTVLFVPGGQRAFISWSAPLISRKDPAKAKIFGPGYCGTVVDGYIGNGTFVWPSTVKSLSGYDYTPDTNHWGIDIGGRTGNPIYAVDSGVVVYAGWNDWGYGNVIVIDHGNGWQSLYAHLSEIYAGCGTSVSQGITIGAMGSTGRSTGPHLHFELMNASGVRVNPWDFLTP